MSLDDADGHGKKRGDKSRGPLGGPRGVKAKRRIRSPHPGVVLKKRSLPSGRVSWRARYTDADTGREVYETLDATALRTREARRLWAIRKSRALAKRRMEVEAGAQRAEAHPIQAALLTYRESAAKRLNPTTLVTYELAFGPFERWAKLRGVATTADLTRPKLADLRDFFISLPKQDTRRGGKRGERHESSTLPNPVSVNRQLRSVKVLLNAWRVSGFLGVLDRDAISDALKALPTPREQPEYLRPAAIQKLLQGAVRHDAAVFEATRVEHAGLQPRGSTRRYAPIAPFLVFLLLSGCRRGEALGLRWEDVDLDAVDAHGDPVGEIHLGATRTKTRRARTIGLEVSPALRSLLVRMRLAAGRDVVNVFGGSRPYTADFVKASSDRLIADYGAPAFTWQLLRSTCATYLTNAPGIFGAATVFRSAQQLGHSVAVAEKSYLGVHRGIPKDARTLEDAMQVGKQIAQVLQQAAPGPRVVAS